MNDASMTEASFGKGTLVIRLLRARDKVFEEIVEGR